MIRGTERIQRNFIKAIRKAINSDKLFDEINEEAEKLIRGRIRLGQQPSNANKLGYKIDSRSKSRRQRVARLNKTDELYRPGKANLTITGEFIRSIEGRRINGTTKAVFEAKGRHPGYKNKDGKKTKGSLNKDILRGHIKAGRLERIGLREKDKRSLFELVRRFVRRAIRR